MKSARVFIAEDHEITRLGIQSVLMRDPAYETCGEARDGRTAIDQIRMLKPDLAILDVGLPQLNGVEIARQALRHRPDLSVIIFTEIESEQSMRNALDFGVRGFVLKSDPVGDLLKAANAVLQGKTFFSPRLEDLHLSKTKARHRRHGLTGKEREVLQLIVEGKGIKEAARLLFISVKTVETHRSHIMRKLGAHSTARLILNALRNEIVHVPDLTPAWTSPAPTRDSSLAALEPPTSLNTTGDGDRLGAEAGA